MKQLIKFAKGEKLESEERSDNKQMKQTVVQSRSEVIGPKRWSSKLLDINPVDQNKDVSKLNTK